MSDADEGHRGPRAIGPLHLGLHRAAVVGPVGPDPGRPQLLDQLEALGAGGGGHDPGVDGRVGALEHPFGFTGQQGAIDPESESDP